MEKYIVCFQMFKNKFLTGKVNAVISIRQRSASYQPAATRNVGKEAETISDSVDCSPFSFPFLPHYGHSLKRCQSSLW